MVAWNTGAATNLWRTTNQRILSIGGENPTAPFDGTVWNNNATFSPITGLTHQTFYSNTMKRTVGYSIYLPPGYPSGGPFNTIFYMHGNGGTENDYPLDVVPHYAAAHPVIVVFVNAGSNSKYMDSISGAPMFDSYMVETMIIAELIPYIDAHYSTKGTKGGRAITGFSMGGMGALRLGFKYPQLFSSIYSYSAAADDNAGNVAANEPSLYAQMFNSNASAFGAQTCQSQAASNAANIIAQAPAIHFCCGTSDGLLSTNQSLDTTLTGLSIVHDALEQLSGVGHSQTGSWTSQGGHTDLDFMWSHFS